MMAVADLHIHSRFSLATSPKLTVPYLDRWARIKGIDLLGTGDCTHPAWAAELEDQLEEAGDGLYRLKDKCRRDFDSGQALTEELPDPHRRDGAGGSRLGGPAAGLAAPGEPRFVLTGEISTIYRRDGRTRKVHHLVLLPDLRAAAAFRTKLVRVGNIASDGRPILGLDSRDLLELLLEADERSVLIPAHIWTPWFSVLGAKSGFDSVADCYRDLAPYIRAIETGISSNPPMNWAVESLDAYGIVSNSDTHSPEKLGREATVLELGGDFASLRAALDGGRGILETLEFFPQEGKYHWDGHRSCAAALGPEESAARNGLCPSCGKPLTSGVLRRVLELAERGVDEAAPCPPAGPERRANMRPYRSLIPLKELLAELLGCGEGSRRVAAAYRAAVAGAGSELALLLDTTDEELRHIPCPGIPGELLALAVERMRTGKVSIRPGYDGEYGSIRAFGEEERPGLVAPAAAGPKRPRGPQPAPIGKV